MKTITVGGCEFPAQTPAIAVGLAIRNVELAAENARLREALEQIEQHLGYGRDATAEDIARAALNTKE